MGYIGNLLSGFGWEHAVLALVLLDIFILACVGLARGARLLVRRLMRRSTRPICLLCLSSASTRWVSFPKIGWCGFHEQEFLVMD